jgi:undecaprenyl pyrophosphate phosphatase UppP
MDELAATAIHAEPLFIEGLTRLAFISSLGHMLLPQLLSPMREGTVVAVLAMTSFPVTAQLGLVLGGVLLLFAGV